MKPLFPHKILLDSELSYQRFRKYGHHILPNLIFTPDMDIRKPRPKPILSKSKLLKVFKASKISKKVHLNELILRSRRTHFSAFLYIAKKLSKISFLSIRDLKICKSQYKGIFTTWPKYLNQLKTLSYDIWIESPNHLGIELPDKIQFGTDFLRYTRKLEALKIILPKTQYSSYMNDLWRFERFPKSLKKLSISNANFGESPLHSSLACLKNLKSLRIDLHQNSSIMTMKSVNQLLCDITCELEALTVLFVDDFNIDASICERIKQLTKLKKARFKFSLGKHKDNLKNILESLEEDCPLKYLNLDVVLRSGEDIDLITDFLIKKNDLETLKLRLVESEIFEASENLHSLTKAIDNLSKLTSFSFCVQNSPLLFDTLNLLPEDCLVFKTLFSKPIPLKRLKLNFHQDHVSSTRFFALLESLKKISPTLEKLWINIGKYEANDDETKRLHEFISGLKSIHLLKLDH